MPERTRAHNPWAFTAIAAIGCLTFVVLIMVIPDEEPAMRTALLGTLVLAGQAAVGRWISVRTDDVHIQIAALAAKMASFEAMVSRDTAAMVSRETSRSESRKGKKR